MYVCLHSETLGQASTTNLHLSYQKESFSSPGLGHGPGLGVRQNSPPVSRLKESRHFRHHSSPSHIAKVTAEQTGREAAKLEKLRALLHGPSTDLSKCLLTKNCSFVRRIMK